MGQKLQVVGLDGEEPFVLRDRRRGVAADLVDLGQGQARGAGLGVVEGDGTLEPVDRVSIALLLGVQAAQLVERARRALGIRLEELLDQLSGALGLADRDELDQSEDRLLRSGLGLEGAAQLRLGRGDVAPGPQHAPQDEAGLGVAGRQLEPAPGPLLGALAVLELEGQLRRLAGDEGRGRVQRERLLVGGQGSGISPLALEQSAAQVFGLGAAGVGRNRGGRGRSRREEEGQEEGDVQASGKSIRMASEPSL